MTIKVHVTDADYSRPKVLDRDAAPQNDGLTIDWRELAERRLGRLTEVEHDVAIARDRLDYLQSNYRVLLRQSEERLRRIRELERELSERRTPRPRLRGVLGRGLSKLSPRFKSLILSAIRMLLRIPLVRPVAHRLVRFFPRLGNRLRGGLDASRKLQ
jgi:hypothetical protein